MWDTEGKEIEKEARQKEEDEETRNFPTPELPKTMCAGKLRNDGRRVKRRRPRWGRAAA